MVKFIPGLQLSELFYHEVIKLILAADFPDVPYSAALFGPGSEVLGFDDEMSSDHDWGPRLWLFLREEDEEMFDVAIRETLSHKLPRQFRGYSTDFVAPDAANTHPQNTPIQHRVALLTFRRVIWEGLHFNIDQAIEPADWLSFPQHYLREITSGAIYYDAIGLEAARKQFSYYPHDVWFYLLLASWQRIGQEQHLMGRAGYVGDELGSAIMGSRLVREVMRLCFLLEKQYIPYPKWFGTAFSQLSCGPALVPVLSRVQFAATWQEREQHLGAALEYVVAMHNQLAITEPVPARQRQFHDRPFHIVGTEDVGIGGFIQALRAGMTDEKVRRIADDRLFGSVDHISDNPDFLMAGKWRIKLHSLYE